MNEFSLATEIKKTKDLFLRMYGFKVFAWPIFPFGKVSLLVENSALVKNLNSCGKSPCL